MGPRSCRFLITLTSNKLLFYLYPFQLKIIIMFNVHIQFNKLKIKNLVFICKLVTKHRG